MVRARITHDSEFEPVYAGASICTPATLTWGPATAPSGPTAGAADGVERDGGAASFVMFVSASAAISVCTVDAETEGIAVVVGGTVAPATSMTVVIGCVEVVTVGTVVFAFAVVVGVTVVVVALVVVAVVALAVVGVAVVVVAVVVVVTVVGAVVTVGFGVVVVPFRSVLIVVVVGAMVIGAVVVVSC